MEISKKIYNFKNHGTVKFSPVQDLSGDPTTIGEDKSQFLTKVNFKKSILTKVNFWKLTFLSIVRSTKSMNSVYLLTVIESTCQSAKYVWPHNRHTTKKAQQLLTNPLISMRANGTPRAIYETQVLTWLPNPSHQLLVEKSHENIFKKSRQKIIKNRIENTKKSIGKIIIIKKTSVHNLH